MSRRLPHFIFLLMFTGCIGQKTDRLVEKYIATITAVDLQKHLTIVASDEMEGRETGAKGHKKSGDYLLCPNNCKHIQSTQKCRLIFGQPVQGQQSSVS
jgi:hypothetical protein